MPPRLNRYPTSINIPPAVHRRLLRQARERHLSLSALIVMWLSERLEREEKALESKVVVDSQMRVPGVET